LPRAEHRSTRKIVGLPAGRAIALEPPGLRLGSSALIPYAAVARSTQAV